MYFSSPKSVVTVWYILFCIRFAMAIGDLAAISYKLFKAEKSQGLWFINKTVWLLCIDITLGTHFIVSSRQQIIHYSITRFSTPLPLRMVLAPQRVFLMVVVRTCHFLRKIATFNQSQGANFLSGKLKANKDQ